ncbi:MAG: putative cytosol aminopeptidase [Alphaproteobacteria bacterium MarineAlpha2_Bin1]|nr:MAG: putative cytosol aminopeptidase [Alphaproteobacteria bacterium MarineAlpha2_Bin1]
MLPYFFDKKVSNSVPLWVVKKGNLNEWLNNNPKNFSTWLKSNDFNEVLGNFLTIPKQSGKIAGVVVIVPKKISIWSIAHIPVKIKNKYFVITGKISSEEETKLLTGWGLGTYRFDKYKKKNFEFSSLYISKKVNWQKAKREIEATFFVRNLVNLPANDLGPGEFEKAAKSLASDYNANIDTVIGNDLLVNFPSINTVGNASNRSPRLIDIKWGKNNKPKVVLIGKSVCFDSGGLDIKSSIGMRKMKKDMGGGAIALGLAYMIMDAGLNIDLRVLLPTVENVIGGKSYKPGDIINTKSGITVEIGNTDAEGRLILADAITEANKKNPDLIISLATLTGAARIALGSELPAVFSNNEDLISELKLNCEKQEDYFWQLPLWKGYEKHIDSNVADLNNSGNTSFAGAITAALFLLKFVKNKRDFVHIDAYSWNDRDQAGRPIGGEASLLRGLFSFLQKRYN